MNDTNNNPVPNLNKLLFLKLGGSLITNKNQPNTVRQEILYRLAQEIAEALRSDPKLSLIIGHGSGSFGHVAGKHYGTRQGVRTAQEWLGFTKVWHAAQMLNRFVLDALTGAGLPVIGFSPFSSITAESGQIKHWDLTPLQSTLRAGLVPVVYGDVVCDTQLGGTILSTEDLFNYLARQIKPGRILLAGIEAGVWADYPTCSRLVEEITPSNFPGIARSLGASNATDVTGGMLSKVQINLNLVSQIPWLDILIFSGTIPGNILRALGGAHPGTRIHI